MAYDIYSKAGTDEAISSALADSLPTAPADIGAATAAQGAKADASDVDQITLTGDLVLTLPVGRPAGQVYRCAITQDGVGGHTVTYGGQPVAVALGAGAATTIELVPVGAGYVVRYPAPGPAGGINVTAYGATGDGVTNDTAAFAAAVAAAGGATITVPAGSYLLDRLIISGRADFLLDDAATLLAQAPSATNRMFEFTGTYLRIRGGTIDGRRTLQTGVWPSVVYGQVQSGKSVILDGVRFERIVRTALFAQEFGGYIQITGCEFTDQSEHSGVNGQYSTILDVTSGEVGAKGHIRFNHNRAIFTATPAVAGGNPGGIFINTQAAGVHDGAGNLSTIEAIGNHFYGYGQNAFGNDISPIHTYPTPGGLRVIGNYFEACGFCAISAKSSQSTIITGNVIVNGTYSTANISTEGAISYAPGSHSEAYERPRAVSANNIVSSPGGTSEAAKQYGIAVIGSATSMADNVIVSGNVLANCGYGINVRYARDVTISGNQIEGASGGAAGTEMGIRFQNTIDGNMLITGNKLDMSNGMGINLHDANSSTASVVIVGNSIRQTASNAAINLRGAKVAKCSANYIDASTSALYVGADTSARPVVHFAWDASNTIAAGASTLSWAGITKASGELFGAGTPVGTVTPAAIGTRYRQTDGAGTVEWLATGITSADWAQVRDSGSATPSITAGAGAGTDPTISITGTNTEGMIEVVAGATPTAGAAIVSVTFSSTRSSAPRAVFLDEASSAAAARVANVYVNSTSLTTSGFIVSDYGTALTAASTYRWFYRVF